MHLYLQSLQSGLLYSEHFFISIRIKVCSKLKILMHIYIYIYIYRCLDAKDASMKGITTIEGRTVFPGP